MVIKHCYHGRFQHKSHETRHSLKYKDILSKDELSSAIEKPSRNGDAPLYRIIINTIEKVSSHVLPYLLAINVSFITINTKITR